CDPADLVDGHLVGLDGEPLVLGEGAIGGKALLAIPRFEVPVGRGDGHLGLGSGDGAELAAVALLTGVLLAGDRGAHAGLLVVWSQAEVGGDAAGRRGVSPSRPGSSAGWRHR